MMRRSICLADPAVAYAGQIKNWKFTYTTATNLPQGTRLKFDLALSGRPTDWEIPLATSEPKLSQIWLLLPKGQTVYAEEVFSPNLGSPAFEFILPTEVKIGDNLEFHMGASSSAGRGNKAQTISQRRRPFHLYIDPKGKGDYKDPEIFTLDVRGNLLKKIRILAPSWVSKNRRFDVVVRFEDDYGNLTSNAPEGTLVELSYQLLRENLNWKLFVPETGFIVLPNLYFNEPGVYQIQLKTFSPAEIFYSSPIKCFADNDYSLYWGLLHGESPKVDATDGIESFLREMRDEKGYQFISSSPFEDLSETSNEHWKSISSHVQEGNEDGRFTTLLGLQWFGDEQEGLREFIHWKDQKPLMRKKDSKYTNLKKIYKIHTPKELLSIPCFTMAKGFETNFAEYSPEFERVVEIYNAWGSSECTEKEGNQRPIKTTSKQGISETGDGSIRSALNRNFRFGFTGGGLDDRGIYAPLFESGQIQYSPGLTAIVAIEQTREALMQALYNRSCYATTGPRIVLAFYIAGSPMGSELSTQTKPGLAYNRHLTGFVCGTAPIETIEIIRCGTVFYTSHPGQVNVDFEVDDGKLLPDVALSSGDDGKPPFVYYYLRVTQKDGHIAWSSPIWVDLAGSIAISPVKKSKKK